MTGVARELLEERRSALGQRSFTTSCKPALIRRRLHHGHRADHPGVIGTAVLGTEDVVGPDLGGLEPQLHVPTWDGVDLGSESREIQAVQHVFRSHRDLDRAARRDVQLINLALAFEVLKLPHPLLADRVNLHRLFGWAAQVVEDRGAPAEHDHGNHRGNHTPQQLHREIALDACPNLTGVTTVIFDPEADDQRRDEQREERRHRGDEKIQRVDVHREGGRLLGKDRDSE